MTAALTHRPIALAADHRGFALKERLAHRLLAQGRGVLDCGARSATLRVDAMDYALALVAEIRDGRSDLAVGVCGTGQMMAITANRFPFIRAALVRSSKEAVSAREHGDANILVLGADLTAPEEAEEIVETFLTTGALEGRYGERRARLAALKTTWP